MYVGCGNINEELVQTPGQSTKAFRVPTKTEMEKSLVAVVERHGIKWTKEVPASGEQNAAQTPAARKVSGKAAISQKVSEDPDEPATHDDADGNEALWAPSSSEDEDEVPDAEAPPQNEPRSINFLDTESTPYDARFFDDLPTTAHGSFISESGNNGQYGAF